MATTPPAPDAPFEGESDFYRRVLDALDQSDVPYLVGGAYALQYYTGIERYTKDFDVFLRAEDTDRALADLTEQGWCTERPFPHWLAKAHSGGHLVDLIYGAGNGVALVDDLWFAHAEEGRILGRAVRFCPAEEMIWSKAFIMERERYDGADVAHLLRARAERLDWARLARRFGRHWRVLIAHLVLFGFIYPAERNRIPSRLLSGLLQRVDSEGRSVRPGPAVCQGTLLSRAQYLVDVERWGYRDGRLAPDVAMSEEDIAVWTDAIAPEVRPE
jgi:hypothetical protein